MRGINDMKQTDILIIVLGCLLMITGCSMKKEAVEDLDYKDRTFYDSEGTTYFTDSDGSHYYSTHYSSDYPKGLIGANYRAADALLQRDKGLQFNRNRPLLVTSFVDIDDVQRSSTFGLTLAEQIGSRIAQRGFKVVEMKMRTSNIFVRGNRFPQEQGEFMLSRELHEISLQHDAYAIVVGTYAQSKRRVYVTAKMINTEDNVILASYDYELPIGPDTKYLLRNNRRTR